MEKMVKKLKKLRSARGKSLLALTCFVPSLLVFLPSAHAAINLPKGSWQVCSDSAANPNYCVESVLLISQTGVKTPLTWSTSGASLKPANNLAVAGKALPGSWSTNSWASVGLAESGYGGIFIDAKAANEFVPWVFVDVQPAISNGGNVALAANPNSPNYPINLAQEVTISITLRIGEIKTGVTFGVGVDVSVDTQQLASYSTIILEGNPVTVPSAKSSKDCVGNLGVATSLTRQFQSVIVPKNDPLGFDVAGTSGKLYVGSNGICKLSTPIWKAETKHFVYSASAPRLAPDGTTINKGFYRAIIPIADAKVLWGLTNPNDAAKALVVSLITSDGGTKVATSTIAVLNGNIIIEVSNFDFPDPALDIALNPNYSSTSAQAPNSQVVQTPEPTASTVPVVNKQKPTVAKPKTTTIACQKGKLTKKITAVKPVCPKGYSRKK